MFYEFIGEKNSHIQWKIYLFHSNWMVKLECTQKIFIRSEFNVNVLKCHRIVLRKRSVEKVKDIQWSTLKEHVIFKQILIGFPFSFLVCFFYKIYLYFGVCTNIQKLHWLLCQMTKSWNYLNYYYSFVETRHYHTKQLLRLLWQHCIHIRSCLCVCVT